ncbi:MAG: TIGR00341 family protein [Alistipes sp.]
MSNLETDAKAEARSNYRWMAGLREFMRGRFSLEEDKAQSEEVIASIEKGVVFRGVNLWVLIFATLIASLGLNVNSAAVIIGAMLISPIMGPIMGVGVSLGINDFDLLKKSLRNLTLMFIVAIVTSTLYFSLTPLADAGSELLARTVPTTYDVLIALFGGLAGIVAQSRKDRTSTVIPGVAIATALIPPLCTAGFGLATGQFRYFFGAFYLFFINSVFIALATFLMVRFLKYERKAMIDKIKERNVRRLMLIITLATFIPSVFIGLRMVRVSVFEKTANRYVEQVFSFPTTRVIECDKFYEQGISPSRIELLLVGEPLAEDVIDHAKSQLTRFGLSDVELVVRQASNADKMDMGTLQKSYVELLEEKNKQIAQMQSQLANYQEIDMDVNGISQEVGVMMPSVGALVLTKGVRFDTQNGACDTLLLCQVTPRTATQAVDTHTLKQWLQIRTKIENIKLFIEEQPLANGK